MDLATARQAIVAGLAPVATLTDGLAGRVEPYPPILGRQSGPGIWVEQPEVTTASAGQNSTVVVAEFPVWIVVDGTSDAQVALLDDAVSQVWAAMRAATVDGGALRPTGVTTDVVEVDLGGGRESRRRAAVVAVEVVTSAVTFCAPVPEPVPVPPTLVSATN